MSTHWSGDQGYIYIIYCNCRIVGLQEQQIPTKCIMYVLQKGTHNFTGIKLLIQGY